ncbi:MAG: DUF6514 family protein [Eubacteriales bacterium]
MADDGCGYEYSVRVFADCGDANDHASVCDITRDELLARSFFSSLCDGQVTPCTLLEIAEDYAVICSC